MTQLTPYESAQLQKLASKAGIRIPASAKTGIPLSRKEVKRIEIAVQRSCGDPVILIRKRSSVRVLSLETYKAWQKNGVRVGGGNKTKETANVNSANSL